jgi:hypothetical protein
MTPYPIGGMDIPCLWSSPVGNAQWSSQAHAAKLVVRQISPFNLSDLEHDGNGETAYQYSALHEHSRGLGVLSSSTVYMSRRN